jgi:transcription antitermination protein NusB
MSLPPQKFREIVFLLLYRNDFIVDELDETILLIMDNLKVTKRSVLEAQAKVMQIAAHLEQIDEKISKGSTEYSFERISSVEKTILRLGLYEILYDTSLEPKIAFAEAIRLTRKFGSPESANFVNAVLDSVYKDGSKLAEEPVSL